MRPDPLKYLQLFSGKTFVSQSKIHIFCQKCMYRKNIIIICYPILICYPLLYIQHISICYNNLRMSIFEDHYKLAKITILKKLKRYNLLYIWNVKMIDISTFELIQKLMKSFKRKLYFFCSKIGKSWLKWQNYQEVKIEVVCSNH